MDTRLDFDLVYDPDAINNLPEDVRSFIDKRLRGMETRDG